MWVVWYVYVCVWWCVCAAILTSCKTEGLVGLVVNCEGVMFPLGLG